MAEDVDREWAKQLRSELAPLVSDDKKPKIHEMLTKQLFLNRTEADACIEALSELKENDGINLKSVVRDSLPAKMKPSFKEKAANDIAAIVAEPPKPSEPEVAAPATKQTFSAPKR